MTRHHLVVTSPPPPSNRNAAYSQQIVRSLVQAGLHRCPYRYAELSIDDREIRKRIFWSAYALDRFLSQALGLPLGIQDDDFDLCLPGMHEKHEPVAVPKEPVAEGSPEETILHLPSDHLRRRNSVVSLL